ncbi:MAG: Fe-S cluster assembly protein SufD [Betaproteobacteria bacterium]|nr:Fe-S cluster assembly protein SufD [Betaproteobacteria bacterium]MDH5343273.1 Fe-S cluster assembly protein SufD [Betaproteobacteria bacterium]
MTVQATHPYVASLLAGSTVLPQSNASWLNTRRAVALERANSLSVPTTRDEEWRFTDLTPLTRVQFQPVSEAAAVNEPDIAAFAVPEAAVRLTFVDGVYAPALSQSGRLPAGCTVELLADALKNRPAQLEPHLAKLAHGGQELFTALNTAFLQHGAVIHVAKNTVLKQPVHLLFVATRENAAAYPRCLVVAETGAECAVIEDYVALSDKTYLTNAVTEIAVAANASVRHIKLQRESAAAFHISTCAVTLAKDARYFGHAVTFGARLSRNNLGIIQQGEGAHAQIDGIALIGGRQLADTHTLMDHTQPNGTCEQVHKTIVGGGAHAVFNGKVFVREGAQLTDSSQQSRNLLLSDKAHVDTKPQLEIFADDVKCAHGATVGQLDAESLFYLKSRGLSDAQARNLLTYAFGAEIIDRIPVPSLVAQLEKFVMARTEGGI